MKLFKALFYTVILITITVTCHSQTYFVPSYAGLEMLDHNPVWILQNKVKAIRFSEHLVGSGKPEKNVTIRLLFDDSGRVIRRYTNHGINDSEELNDERFASKEIYRYEWKDNFCYKYELTIRNYDEKGKLAQPDTVGFGEAIINTYNPLKILKEIYYQDTTYYIFDNLNNLTKKYKPRGNDDLSIEYDEKGQLIKIVRNLKIGKQPGQSSKYLFKHHNGQISNVIIYQFSGPKVSFKYYYDETNHLVKNELFMDDKLMSFYEYQYEEY